MGQTSHVIFVLRAVRTRGDTQSSQEVVLVSPWPVRGDSQPEPPTDSEPSPTTAYASCSPPTAPATTAEPTPKHSP
jgi:hypothetical protein